jgi:hypothetical protein
MDANKISRTAKTELRFSSKQHHYFTIRVASRPFAVQSVFGSWCFLGGPAPLGVAHCIGFRVLLCTLPPENVARNRSRLLKFRDSLDNSRRLIRGRFLAHAKLFVIGGRRV